MNRSRTKEVEVPWCPDEKSVHRSAGLSSRVWAEPQTMKNHIYFCDGNNIPLAQKYYKIICLFGQHPLLQAEHFTCAISRNLHTDSRKPRLLCLQCRYGHYHSALEQLLKFIHLGNLSYKVAPPMVGRSSHQYLTMASPLRHVQRLHSLSQIPWWRVS